AGASENGLARGSLPRSGRGQQTGREPGKNVSVSDRSPLWAFLCLLVVETSCFGIMIRNIGVYLDEWISFQLMHFGAQDFACCVKGLLFSASIVHRPLEALQFAPIYVLVHEKPFLYHLVNNVCELGAAVFLFLFLRQLTREPKLPLAAAILFLLYPTHDDT